jgi:UDP-N-acetylmuramate-alanine ligase
LADIYPAREEKIEGISSELILDEYNKSKTSESSESGYYIENKEMILDKLEIISREGDVIIFQGAGDITELCGRYVKRVKDKSNFKVPL